MKRPAGERAAVLTDRRGAAAALGGTDHRGALAALVILLLGLSACSREARCERATAAVVATPDQGAPALVDAGVVSLAAVRTPLAAPPVTEAAAFVGAAVCGRCHEEEHQRWRRDWHARALSPAQAEFVVGDFRGVHFRGPSSEAWLRGEAPTGATAARYLMRTRGPNGALGDYPIHYVIGGRRMQDTLTVLPDGRFQVLPVYYHVSGPAGPAGIGAEGRRGWVDYTESKQGALTPDHPFFWANFRRTANHECLDCHTTGLRVSYTPAPGGGHFKTEWKDAGVACESCHGPGARHARTRDPADIIHPSDVPPEVGLALCAQCHGPRSPLFPLFDAAHRFQPGGRYDDAYQALVVVDGPGRSGDFFADGRPKTSSFEYQALLQSACYRKGGATCLTCHGAPHGDTLQSELRRPRGESQVAGQRHSHVGRGSHARAQLQAEAADASCQGCHQELTAQREAHSRHRGRAAQRCTACHMPAVVSGVLDRFADHALDIPVPGNTARHGVPSACGTCHSNRSAETLSADLLRLWPAAAARQARRLRLADAIDEGTAAGSRDALLGVLADEAEAPTLRGVAAVLLAQRFPKEAVAPLLPLLSHRESLLRARAAEALGYTRDRGAAGSPVAVLLNDPVLAVRHTAALTLAVLGDGRAEPAARALAQDPASEALPQPHFVLGGAALRRGDLQAARRELLRAIALVPYHADALVLLADVELRLGDAPRAREWLYEALRFNPQHRGARERMRLARGG